MDPELRLFARGCDVQIGYWARGDNIADATILRVVQCHLSIQPPKCTSKYSVLKVNPSSDEEGGNNTLIGEDDAVF